MRRDTCRCLIVVVRSMRCGSESISGRTSVTCTESGIPLCLRVADRMCWPVSSVATVAGGVSGPATDVCNSRQPAGAEWARGVPPPPPPHPPTHTHINELQPLFMTQIDSTEGLTRLDCLTCSLRLCECSSCAACSGTASRCGFRMPSLTPDGCGIQLALWVGCRAWPARRQISRQACSQERASRCAGPPPVHCGRHPAALMGGSCSSGGPPGSVQATAVPAGRRAPVADCRAASSCLPGQPDR